MAKRKEASAREVRAFLTSVMRGEQDLPPRERIRAAELLGRGLDMWRDSVEVTLPKVIVDDIAGREGGSHGAE